MLAVAPPAIRWRVPEAPIRMIRVLVVDDEEPARARLASLLAAFPDVEIVGEAVDGPEAIERIAALRPDAVFLDVEMPGCSGLDVAASLAAPRPQIVFCTAFDGLRRRRLRARVGRLSAQAGEPGAAGGDGGAAHARARRRGQCRSRVRAAPAPSASPAPRNVERYPERFLARRLQRYHVVSASDVLFFAIDDGSPASTPPAGHYWMQPTLNDLEARLDPARFFRVSRAVIVAIGAVREVQPHRWRQRHAHARQRHGRSK